jgi:hypothetical protein
MLFLLTAEHLRVLSRRSNRPPPNRVPSFNRHQGRPIRTHSFTNNMETLKGSKPLVFPTMLDHALPVSRISWNKVLPMSFGTALS